MTYREFRKKVDKLPVIPISQLSFLEKNKQVLRNQAFRWEKQGLILRLRKGLFVLNENDRKINPSKVFIANQLYASSYISTEYALGFYNLIPEKVADVTSVTSRKTYKFTNVFGVFVYQHISPKAFKGFIILKDENNYPFFIAYPEKAIVDYIYLNLSAFNKNDIKVFSDSLRLQNLEQLNKHKLMIFTDDFNNEKLKKIITNLCKVIRK